MNPLIPIHSTALQHDTIQTVNARDLHAFLEVGKDFSTWLKDRIQQYGFIEGTDFVWVFPSSGGNSKPIETNGLFCSPKRASKHGGDGHNRILFNHQWSMSMNRTENSNEYCHN